MSTIHEIVSELERLANDIGAINMRPFADRIDFQQNEVAATGEHTDEGQKSGGRLDS